MLETVVAVVVGVGTPALLCLFYLEGLVLGKLVQPPLVFVAFVAATGPDHLPLALLAAGCAVAATLGQWTLYRGFRDDAPELFGIRRTVPVLDSLPERVQRRVGDSRLATVERYFDAYGGFALAGSNAIPGVRSLMTIPAGIGRYPQNRFLVASAIGNVAYVALLVAAASGVSWIARVVAG